MRYKKKPKPAKPITIVYDDREKHPWRFLSVQWPMKKKRLKVGDYSIEGYEDKVAIEKKSGINELLADLAGSYRPTFERFLKKMSQYPVKLIVVEDAFINSDIYSKVAILKKKSRSRLTIHTIYHWTIRIAAHYDIPILFLDPHSVRELVTTLFEQLQKKVQEL